MENWSQVSTFDTYFYTPYKVEEVEYEDPATFMEELISRQEEVLEELKNLKALIRGEL